MSEKNVNDAMSEEVVAVLPDQQELTEVEKERNLSNEVKEIEFKADSFLVRSDEEFEEAAELGVFIKRKSAEVTEFFKPLKDAAYKAHKEICNKEKEMLTPLVNAEKTIKSGMAEYQQEKERKRKELEEKARREAQEEAERKLQEAIDLEEAGDIEGSNSAFADAQIVNSIGSDITIPAEQVKVKGVSVAKDWEITLINDAEVPVGFSGVVLRPIDEKAIMRLIRASKGSINIPGVQYKEVSKISIRK